MPTGIIINSLSIILGGIAGGLFGDYLRDDFKENLNLIFGLASMVMGISAIINMVNMPAVIFAVVIGTIIGLALKFGNLINKGAGLMEKGLSKITPSKQTVWDDRRCFHLDFQIYPGFLYGHDFLL